MGFAALDAAIDSVQRGKLSAMRTALETDVYALGRKTDPYNDRRKEGMLA